MVNHFGSGQENLTDRQRLSLRRKFVTIRAEKEAAYTTGVDIALGETHCGHAFLLLCYGNGRVPRLEHYFTSRLILD